MFREEYIFLSPPFPPSPFASFIILSYYHIYEKNIQNANLKILFVYFSKIIWSFKMFCYVQKRDIGNFLFQFLFPFHRIFYWYYKPYHYKEPTDRKASHLEIFVKSKKIKLFLKFYVLQNCWFLYRVEIYLGKVWHHSPGFDDSNMM